jgi:ABC-2 type transport system permease protein
VALCKKEFLQVIRDPSSILIAVVIPFILLFFFGFAVSLDTARVDLCVVDWSCSTSSRSLLSHFNTPKFKPYFTELPEAEELLTVGKVHGILIVPEDFEERINEGESPLAYLVVKGTDPNTAQIVRNYVYMVVLKWLREEGQTRTSSALKSPPILLRVRYWYNPEAETKFPLVVGSIAVIMTLIGTMLTSLVVAREWERNTAESLFSVSISKIEFLTGKFTPYFVLGMSSMFVVSVSAVVLLKVPFRGSLWWLVVLSASFLLYSLGLGFLISTITKNQFLATLVALIVGFLPAFILSGLVFEIESMPKPIQFLTYLFAPRYFVFALRTLFLVGSSPEILTRSTLTILLLSLPWWLGVVLKTRTSLESEGER